MHRGPDQPAPELWNSGLEWLIDKQVANHV
jgi:hypothetical protein